MEATLLQNASVARVPGCQTRTWGWDVGAGIAALAVAVGSAGGRREGRPGRDVWFVVQQLDSRKVVRLHRAGAHGTGEPALFETGGSVCAQSYGTEGGREAVVPMFQLSVELMPVV